MRTKDGLKQLKEITILLQYLYLDESHEVTVSNGSDGYPDLYVGMISGSRRKTCSSRHYLNWAYTGEMTVPNMLAIHRTA